MKDLVPVESIISKILLQREEKVLMDNDIAKLYGVETSALNRAVKRNIDRFPEDFMFQLDKDEAQRLRCQNGISKPGRGGRRYLPYAFTEQGIGAILPVLKPAAHLENVRKQLAENGRGAEAPPMLHEKLNDDIYIFYVFDFPESISFISKEDMKKLKLDAAEIRKTAVSNLEKYYSSIGASVRQLDTKKKGKINSFDADRNYEASALLTKSIWNKTTIPVDGELVGFTPARNILFIVGDDDPIGIQVAS